MFPWQHSLWQLGGGALWWQKTGCEVYWPWACGHLQQAAPRPCHQCKEVGHHSLYDIIYVNTFNRICSVASGEAYCHGIFYHLPDRDYVKPVLANFLSVSKFYSYEHINLWLLYFRVTYGADFILGYCNEHNIFTQNTFYRNHTYIAIINMPTDKYNNKTCNMKISKEWYFHCRTCAFYNY